MSDGVEQDLFGFEPDYSSFENSYHISNFSYYNTDLIMDPGISPQELSTNSRFAASQLRGTHDDGFYTGHDRSSRTHHNQYGDEFAFQPEARYSNSLHYPSEPWNPVGNGHLTTSASQRPRHFPEPMVKTDSNDSTDRTLESMSHLGSYSDDSRSVNLALGTGKSHQLNSSSPSTSHRARKQKGVAPRHASISSSYEEEPNLYCKHPDCLDPSTGQPGKRYSRPADVERHRRSTHERAYYPCPMKRCHRRDEESFTRKDHLTEHLRGTHGRDIPKGRGAGDKRRTGYGSIKKEDDIV